ncbi:hepatocyte growth factor-like protein, partial [Ruditapes philippinarum]|uniref:hepatocyte growth factor-like protein n=1 Tax=Ruditapes philippinarum TaxID=129788 RepID=UPI00295BBBF0
VVIDCYITTVDNYIGHQQTTKDGTPCIRWDSKDYEDYTNEQFRDATVSDAANFCRAVGENYLWCWTSHDWDRCGIEKCVVIDCYSTTVDDYNGHQQTTKDGTPCIRWDSNVLHVYENEQFIDSTVSDAANFCRNIGENYLWCWTSNSSDWDICGIKECENNGINKCGNLKIKQPALLGRNVTFTFTPDSQDPNAILEWQQAADDNPWYTRPLTYKFTQYYDNGTYYMVLTDSLLKDDEVYYRIHYYNESVHCWMKAGKLELDGKSIFTS